MPNPIPFRLDADHHVHSTFSDGRGTLEENVIAARRLGLSQLGFVDHVRATTDWVAQYAAAVARLSTDRSMELTCGVEAKILDLDGTLDLPERLPGVQRILAADHQMPGPSGPIHPDEVREALRRGDLTAHRVVDDLVTATEAAMRRRPGLVLAHLFSLLPKMGLAEDDVADEYVARLADAARRSGATLEVSERWRCPSLRVVRAFHDAGVRVVASTDAHAPHTIGRYYYVATIRLALEPELARMEVGA